jgi:hypothetical protein
LLAAWAAEVLLVELVLDVVVLIAAVLAVVVELTALVAMVRFLKGQSDIRSGQDRKT